ncbi:MAG: undecaprenyldiphospho-muramoylpentapeptide beta-N-acetylglucosaminyltransferase [Rhodobacteraceae bacterium]|nr:undecaprenyldiphospho-muramoylpentapeptide beta-N-acetylglucosaminyltransferase [Paracoccaceae bacterium]
MTAESNLLVIAAGGTGGHMFPAQALAQEMLRRGWRVALSTDDRGLRYADGFPAEVQRRKVQSATFARGGFADKMKTPFKIAAGVSDAIDWFREAKPAVVAGFGGYPSLPALTAAWRLRLPRMIHEQNGVLGRVNRVFASRVDALACGVTISNAPAGAPRIFVGNPVRDAVLAAAESPYAAPEPDGEIRLLVFGGSQGASVFADRVPPALLGLPTPIRERIRLTQQVREAEMESVSKVYQTAELNAELAPFFPDMPARLAASHLVISRAGASTIAELTAIGRPAILAPYPAAMSDHQTFNARALSDHGAALLAPDVKMTPESLRDQITQLLERPETLADMAMASRGLGKPNATQDLAELVTRVANRQ